MKYNLSEDSEGDYQISDTDIDVYDTDIQKDSFNVLKEMIPMKDSIQTLSLTNVSPERHFVYFLQMMIIGCIGMIAFKKKVKL